MCRKALALVKSSHNLQVTRLSFLFHNKILYASNVSREKHVKGICKTRGKVLYPFRYRFYLHLNKLLKPTREKHAPTHVL